MDSRKPWAQLLVLLSLASLTGCGHMWGRSHGCGACEQASCDSGCKAKGRLVRRGDDCQGCGGCGNCLSALEWKLFGWMCRKSNAIPETLPLGSTVMAHSQVMQTNGEAADFILYRHEFIGQTAELTPDGKDHILEIAARMRSAPFPVLVEREPNNSDPELDAHRRNLVAMILTDLGNPDAQQRTVVSTSYGPGYVSTRGERMYYQHIYGNNNAGFGNGGIGGGGGGGGFF